MGFGESYPLSRGEHTLFWDEVRMGALSISGSTQSGAILCFTAWRAGQQLDEERKGGTEPSRAKRR